MSANKGEHSNKDEELKHQSDDLTEEEMEAADDQIGDNDVDQLEESITEAEAEQEKLREQLLRMHAQVENVKRRAERDVASAHKYATEKFVRELLPVVDSLEQALEASSSESATQVMREGIELTMQMLLSALKKMGVSQIDPLHQPFDPAQHEAMTMAPSADHQPNTVITVVQKGYLLHERVVRPARVIVAKEA